MLTDKQVSEKYGIPRSTVNDWRNSNKESWRYKVYLKLKGCQNDS